MQFIPSVHKGKIVVRSGRLRAEINKISEQNLHVYKLEIF